MFRFPRLAMVLLLSAVVTITDPDTGETHDMNLFDVAALPDDEYKEIFGEDRHGNFHLREGEEIERDDGWAGDLDRGIYGGDAAGVGGND